MASSNKNVPNVYTSPAETQNQEAVEVSIKTLLDAGAHFGHQTERWNPKMLPYIFGVRNNTHIINLDITLKLWERARKFVSDVLARGGTILFVGTKTQARDIIAQEAERCAGYHVTSRWLGGTLSNFQTIKNSIDRMKKLEDLLAEAEKPDTKVRLVKKERVTIAKQLEKLSATLGGIRLMKRPPDVIFVVDIIKEAIAVSEAKRLHIPVVALVDTNTDPNDVEFPIPSNDDAAKTIKLFTAGIADAVIEGKTSFESRMASEQSEKHGKGGESNGKSHHDVAEVTAADGLGA